MLWGRWEYEFIIDLKEISVNTTNWIDSAKELLESASECGIEPPGSISHVVS